MKNEERSTRVQSLIKEIDSLDDDDFNLVFSLISDLAQKQRPNPDLLEKDH